MKTKLTTTLALLKKNNACKDGYEKLINYLGKDYPEHNEINLLTILKSNGVEHCLWAFRATLQDFEIAKQPLVNIACDIAESILPFFEEKNPGDKRPRTAIEAARNLLKQNDSVGARAAQEAAQEAAWAEPWAAEEAAARAAAQAAAWAAQAAAWAVWAARAAAQAAEEAAARAAQAAARSAQAAAWAAQAVEEAADEKNLEIKKQISIIKKYLKI